MTNAEIFRKDYEKPFGTFTLIMLENEDGVSIWAETNGERFKCDYLHYEKKAVVFTLRKMKINGKVTKINGCSLPDFDAVYAVLKASELKIQESKKRAKDDIVAEYKNNKKEFALSFYDGEYLSGWTLYEGIAIELLQELGIGREVSGWGYHITQGEYDMLGEMFLYSDAKKYVAPKREAEELARIKKETERAVKFEDAKITGTPVIIEQFSVPCSDHNEECNIDIVTIYAMPDGTIKKEQIHTW